VTSDTCHGSTIFISLLSSETKPCPKSWPTLSIVWCRLNVMRSINQRFTYLLTYLLPYSMLRRHWVAGKPIPAERCWSYRLRYAKWTVWGCSRTTWQRSPSVECRTESTCSRNPSSWNPACQTMTLSDRTAKSPSNHVMSTDCNIQHKYRRELVTIKTFPVVNFCWKN